MVLQLSDISPFVPLHTAPLLSQALPPPLLTSMGHIYKFFGYSISYTVLYIFLAILKLPSCVIPSPLHPFPHTPPPTWQSSKCSLYP